MSGKVSRILVAVGGFLLLATLTQAQECSVSQVSGKWAFSSNGTVIGIGPRVSAGIFTLDNSGALQHGKATSSLDGAVASELFSGTYSVSPDCTGQIAVNVFDTSGNKLFTATLAIYFDDNGQEMRAIFTSVVAPNGAALASSIVLDGKKIGGE